MQLSYCVTLVTLLACFLPWILLILSLGGFFARHKQPDEPVTIEPEQTNASDDQLPEGALTVKNNRPSTLHALVIGINEYPKLSKLTGAICDASKMYDFLVNDLGTPPSQIKRLYDAKATRASIIQAFLGLGEDPRIERDSPILIYFAGHGGLADPSPEWVERCGNTSKIQVIFPYDYDEIWQDEKVECIPDRTIAYLLNKLAEAKGDNITVMFDSCHSASANRVSPTGGGRQARAAKVNRPIPIDIDNDILLPVPSSAATAPRYLSSPFSAHQTSHIHLAACGSDEHAWEQSGRGEFTTAFLKTIRAHGVDKVSYRNLIVGLPYMTKQTPHCYGAHRDRLLFHGHVPSRKVVFIPVIFDPECKTLVLQAGVASGVTSQSIWELSQYAIIDDEGVVGTTTALSPGISTTDLEVKDGGLEDDKFWKLCELGTPHQGRKLKLYARLVKSGPGNELKVWFSPEAKRVLFPELKGEVLQFSNAVSREFGYVAHPAEDSADMLVRIYRPTTDGPIDVSTLSSEPGAGPEVEFVLCNDDAKKYGVATLPQRKPARRNEVEPVLFTAARWNWYLRHKNNDHEKILVEMEMFKIAKRSQINGVYSTKHWRQLKDHERGSNLNETGVVDFEVHGEDLYGIRLKSAVDRPLYVRMFYFDMKTFSIDDQFGHAVADGRADPEIGRRGQFTIGDDGLGGTPLPFELEAEDAVDIGYMKVFWSTDPLELDHLQQESAFKLQPDRMGRKPGTLQGNNKEGDWGTISVILIQRRPQDSV